MHMIMHLVDFGLVLIAGMLYRERERYENTYECVHINESMYVCRYVCVYIHEHIYTYIYTYGGGV